MIDNLANRIWEDSNRKKRHDETMTQMDCQSTMLWDSVDHLKRQIEEKQQAVRYREELKERYRRYQTDCQKLAFLTNRDLGAARELLRVISERYPKFVRVDSTFPRRVQALLNAETREFQRRLNQVEI